MTGWVPVVAPAQARRRAAGDGAFVMSDTSELLQAALAYARRGWPVLPLQPRGKAPLGALASHGVKDATTDDATIRRWWAARPDANIGIATGGGSGLLVIDVDPRDDGDEALRDLERQYGALPQTVEALTGGGGRHVLLRCPTGQGCGKLTRGIDIKANGGYIVAAPSLHPSGASYAWEVAHHPDDVTIAEPPAWLLALLAVPKPASATAAPAGRLGEGERNSALTSLAGSMRRKGATAEAIEAALLVENAARCDPPLPRADVRRIAASVARYDPGAVSDELLTDLGNCQRFVAQHKDDLRYCPGLGWLVWDGRRWSRDDTGAPMRCAKQTALRLYDEAKAELQRAIDSLSLARAAAAAGGSAAKQAAEQMKAAQTAATRRLAWAEKSQSRQRLESMVALAQSESELVVHVADLDKDPWLLNVQNGTLDLRTGVLREHRREDYLTQMAPVDYDATAPGDHWRAHLETFLPDPDVRRQVQRDLGLSLVAADLEECLPIWYGTGGNGKSTTLKVLHAVLGDYAQMAAPRLLTASKYERHPTELAELRGKRLIFSAETDQSARLDEERVKMLSGGERIRARFMRQDFVEFPRTWTITLITNHKPAIRGVDGGIWRRIRLVPWTVALPTEKQRPQEEVVSELLSEARAVLAWLVAGLRDWQQDHHWRAEAVRLATDTYKEEQDILAGFLADCCELGPRHFVRAATLYETYADWCERNGQEALKKNTFGKLLTARGFAQARQGHGGPRIWRGLRLYDHTVEPMVTHGDTDSGSPGESKDERLVGTYAEIVSPCVTIEAPQGQNAAGAGAALDSLENTATVQPCSTCGKPTRRQGPDGRPLCSFCTDGPIAEPQDDEDERTAADVAEGAIHDG
jgi:putative DNA primase/helicase